LKCHLKSSLSSNVVNASVAFGFKQVGCSSCVFSENTMSPGTYLSGSPFMTFAHNSTCSCASACDSRAECVAWMYDRSQSLCYLKATIDATSSGTNFQYGAKSVCGRGTFSASGSAPCTACPAGTFSSSCGALSCSPCANDAYNVASRSQCQCALECI
jgi:hypothetical protein